MTLEHAIVIRGIQLGSWVSAAAAAVGLAEITILNTSYQATGLMITYWFLLRLIFHGLLKETS